MQRVAVQQRSSAGDMAAQHLAALSLDDKPNVSDGVVDDAAPGVAWLDARTPGAGWALSIEPFDEADFGLEKGDAVPDLNIDQEDGILSLLNSSQRARAYHVSIYDRTLTASNGTLTSCPCRGRRCTTLSVAVPPRTSVDVCAVEGDALTVDLESDVVDIVEPTELEARVYDAFPLPREGGPWLCTQASGGLLSHYAHASTYHAVDFRCPEGTPCLAIGDGVIHAVDVSNEDGSIHVSELFRWNAVTLKLDDGFYAEYVHLASSACKVGDRVVKGDIIGVTGAVGFCPEPHLHLEVHASAAKDAPSVPLRFGDRAPQAGEWWGGYAAAS